MPTRRYASAFASSTVTSTFNGKKGADVSPRLQSHLYLLPACSRAQNPEGSRKTEAEDVTHGDISVLRLRDMSLKHAVGKLPRHPHPGRRYRTGDRRVGQEDLRGCQGKRVDLITLPGVGCGGGRKGSGRGRRERGKLLGRSLKAGRADVEVVGEKTKLGQGTAARSGASWSRGHGRVTSTERESGGLGAGYE